MPINGRPDDLQLQRSALCVLCKQLCSIEDVYVGLNSRDGEPCFACSFHLLHSSVFVKGWAQFSIQQKYSLVGLCMRKLGSNKLYLEQRTPVGSLSVLGDIARHLYTRFQVGKVVVLNSKPRYFVPNLKKEWVKVERMVKRERSSTLEIVLIRELTTMAESVRQLVFSSDRHRSDADVYSVSPEEYIREPILCRTLYMTEEVDEVVYKKITDTLAESVLVVAYKSKSGR